MIVGFRSGLLPILFAVIALLLNVQQANAAVQAPNTSIGMIHVDQHAEQNERCALHITACCSMSMGMVAFSSFGIAYLDYRPAFDLDAGSSPSFANRPSEQFRPPRQV
tara:strand:+ start:4765 stop:5088 length:324 start_codon:yes stop_codon:yes gene_type:complete